MFDAKYKESLLDSTVYKRIEDFWEWFELNKYEIEKCIQAKRKDIVNTIEGRLKMVYIDAKRGVPFAVGYKDEMYVMYLYYGRNSYLLTIGDAVMMNMPKHLKNTWRCVVAK